MTPASSTVFVLWCFGRSGCFSAPFKALSKFVYLSRAAAEADTGRFRAECRDSAHLDFVVGGTERIEVLEMAVKGGDA